MSDGFDIDLEVEILAGSAKDSEYRKIVRRTLQGEDCWSIDSHHTLWTEIEKLGDGDELTPRVIVRASEGLDDDEAEEILSLGKKILKTSPKSKKYAAKELNEWVQVAKMKSSMGQAIKLIGDGKVADAQTALRDGTKVTSLLAYEAGDWYDGFRDRMELRRQRRDSPDLRPVIATRISSLDKALNGGIRLTEFGLIVGHTGRGKSATAAHFSWGSAATGKGTVYISGEMNKELIDTRFDSKFTAKDIAAFTKFKFSKKELEAFESKLLRLKKRLRHNLWTAAVPPRVLTKAMIEEIVDEYEQKHGKKALMLVVDSPDHMRPPAYVREHRLQQTSNYYDVKQVLEERGMAGWGTTQAPKEYVDKLITAEGTSDSYDKARIVDIMVTLNQTLAEEKLQIVRAYVAKNRSGEKGAEIPLATDFARMHIEECSLSPSVEREAS